MSSSSIPLRPRELAILLHERAIQEAMDVYRGNLLWSVLASIHGLAKHELTLPTYGKKLAELRAIGQRKTPAPSQMSNQQVISRVQDMFRTFLPKRGETM